MSIFTKDEIAKLREMVHIEREQCIESFDLPKFGWENRAILKSGIENHVMFLFNLEKKLTSLFANIEENDTVRT